MTVPRMGAVQASLELALEPMPDLFGSLNHCIFLLSLYLGEDQEHVRKYRKVDNHVLVPQGNSFL